MKISKVIERLADIQERHGDIDVNVIDDNCSLLSIEDIEHADFDKVCGVNYGYNSAIINLN